MEVTCANCKNIYNAYYKEHPRRGEVVIGPTLNKNEVCYDIIGIDNKLKAKSECPQCGITNINDEV